MKIGLMIGRSPSEIGGQQQVIKSIRNALGQEHEVVTYSCTKIPWLENNKYFIPFSSTRIALLQIMGGLLCKMAHDCDVLIYPNALFGIPSSTKRPIIIYSHGGFPTRDISKHSWIVKLYGRVFERASSNLFRHVRKDKNIHILTNSQYTTALVRKDVGRESTVIYPEVDMGEFRVKDQTERVGVVSVGTLNRQKCYEITCDVMTHLESPYTIMGRTHDSKERTYHNMLRAKYPSVQLVPNVSVKEMKDRLWGAKVYLHAKIEDFGISIVEAIAAGCVPVVPDAGGIRETVPVSDLRYPPNDLNAIREKVERALAGEYDHHMPFLQKHVERYDTSVFQKSLLGFVQDVCK